ncbi:MAG: hypothetical protein GX821_05805 [Clostridiaceae bacterium]|nr:hypothetical protein [Clostridiaceae bacterium]
MPHAYMFFLLAGAVVLVSGTPISAKLGGLPWSRAVWPVGFALPFAIGGARLFYLLIDTTPGLDPGFKNLASGAYVLYGGVLPGLIVCAAGCRLLGLPIRRYLDRAAPVAGLGIAVARTGCILNGCCFGVPTRLPWGVLPPYGGAAHQMQLDAGWVDHMLGIPLGPLPIHPTQGYEMVAALLSGGLALWLLARHAPTGIPTGFFGLSLSALRWMIFSVRAFPGASTWSLFVRGPLTYGIAILSSLLLLVYSYPRGKFRRTQDPDR